MNLDKKWFQIRFDLYLALKKQVRRRMGGDPEDLKLYRRPFIREANARWLKTDMSDLIQSVEGADLVFWGDFHPLQQSQKAFVRMLKQAEKLKKFKAIALECYFEEHEKFWKDFLAGKISEALFLKRTEWSKNWSFPWENYKPILKWALKHQIELYPCNTLKTHNLKLRDVSSANLILKIFEKNASKNPLVFVLYGDLHLASTHLPLSVQKNSFRRLKIVRVFQNIDEIYFDMVKRNQDHSPEVVKKNQNTFCVLGVPPWVKWQSYLMFLEEVFDKDLYESQIEFTDHVVRYVHFLSEELEHPISSYRCSIYSAQDDHFLDKIRKQCSALQLRNLEKMVEEGYSFFMPEIHQGYLGRITVNHAAGLAMQYFYFEMTQSKKLPWNMPQDFTHMIWLEAVTYFGSKLINPKRRTESIHDLKLSLTSTEKEGIGKEALKLALAQRVREMMVLNSGSLRGLAFKPKRKWSYFLAAHMLGALLGERLYVAYTKKKVSKKLIIKLLSASAEQSTFNPFYYDLLALVE